MAKKEIPLTVDEKKLQSIIAGEYEQTISETTENELTEDTSLQEETPASQKPAKRKKSEENYVKTYLQKRIIENKKPTTLNLDQELMRKINVLLNSVPNAGTVSSFVNNLIAMHINEYREVINKIYEKSRNNLF
ncbi:MAG: DUF3408 domain-containing protein [Clostridium sp.]|nr:DUF3408 domain-containing protein [Clostridium sp.]